MQMVVAIRHVFILYGKFDKVYTIEPTSIVSVYYGLQDINI
jgi:hypothetical protein